MDQQGQQINELFEEVKGCTACGLYKQCGGKVFGEKFYNAPIMIVGEAPGENEDITGRPFTGRAGVLLDKMLDAIDLSRDKNVFITNILKCRPPGNRNPLPDEVKACGTHLDKQIDIIKPKAIIATGGFSTAYLLGKESIKITYVAGKQYEYKDTPLFPIFHPAYLLRNEEKKADTWEHLQSIYKYLEDNQIV